MTVPIWKKRRLSYNMEIWAGLTLGFLGSFHCVGMCGPIALGVVDNRSSISAQIIPAFLYNTGRLLSYSFLGLLIGIIGSGISLLGFQQILSILIGMSMLAFILLPKLTLFNNPTSIYSRFLNRVTKRISHLYNKRTHASTFSIGVLNGFLPCGFVMIALTTSLLTSSPFHSMWYMLFFGLGTFPTMLALNLTPNFFKPSLRSKIRPYSNYFAIFVALFLIYRGFMDLGSTHNVITHNFVEEMCTFPFGNMK